MRSRNVRVHQLFTRFGGIVGLIWSTLPVVAFIAADTFLALVPAVTIALGVAAGVMMWRLWRGESHQPAIAGFLGVAVGATLSLLTGQSKDYFVIHIWMSLFWAIVFTASILVRRPIVGQIWSRIVEPGTRGGRGDDIRLVLTFDVATLVWALMFLSRFVVQHHFYVTDQITWLGIARIAMGWPLTGLAAVTTYLAVRTARRVGRSEDTRHPDR